MTRTAFSRKSPRVPRVCWGWALGTGDREYTTVSVRPLDVSSGFDMNLLPSFCA